MADLSAVKAFINQLREGDKMSYPTIRGILVACRGFYNELMWHEVIAHNPFTHPRLLPRSTLKETRLTKALPLEHINRVLALRLSCKERAIMALLFGCGFRRSEIVNLRREDISTRSETPYIKLKNTKTSEAEVVSIANWVKIALDNYIDSDEYDKGSRMFQISSSGMNCMFKRWMVRCGLDGYGYSCHSARASAITELLNRGYTHRDVMRFSRHSSVSQVERYDRMIKDMRLNPGLDLDYSKPLPVGE